MIGPYQAIYKAPSSTTSNNELWVILQRTALTYRFITHRCFIRTTETTIFGSVGTKAQLRLVSVVCVIEFGKNCSDNKTRHLSVSMHITFDVCMQNILVKFIS